MFVSVTVWVAELAPTFTLPKASEVTLVDARVCRPVPDRETV